MMTDILLDIFWVVVSTMASMTIAYGVVKLVDLFGYIASKVEHQITRPN